MIQLREYSNETNYTELKLAESFPRTHIATLEYINVIIAADMRFSILVGEHEKRIIAAVFLQITKKRFERVASVNVFAIEEEHSIEFWDEIVLYLNRRRIDRVRVNTFSSDVISKPTAGEVRLVRKRWEYIVDLQEYSSKYIHSKHRNKVRKAEKHGVTYSVSCNSNDIEIHINMRCQSMQRRLDNGEMVNLPKPTFLQQQMLEQDAAELFFAKHNDTIVSSALVLKNRFGGYLHSAGTNTTGMKLGASNFLIHSILERYRSRGGRLFNLGGVSEGEEGLESFKKRFGGDKVYKPEYEIRLRKRVLPGIVASLKMFFNNPLRWWKTYLLAETKYVVYSKDLNLDKTFSLSSESQCRALTETELLACKKTEYNKAYRKYFSYGSALGAYGCWIDGELAHTSWLISKDQENICEERNIGLKRKEREITHCYTGEKYRGMGIYPRMIQVLLNKASKEPVGTVYMTAALGNKASRRGIEKAGFTEKSVIIRFTPLPVFKLGIVLIKRGHRRGRDRYSLAFQRK